MIAREYLRVSLDKSGRERSITEQHAENEAEAAERGWSLGEPYADVGSASRYASKARGDYAALIADLQAGRFGADVLILWESSRGSRRASEWLLLIELCAERRVKIHVTSHGGRTTRATAATARACATMPAIPNTRATS
jgi:DNA invertase Pin-like site-specific DNA recombinase